MQHRPRQAQSPAEPAAPNGWTPVGTRYRPLSGPAWVVTALLAVCTLVTLAAVASDLLEVNLLTRLLSDPAGVLRAEASVSTSRQALLGLLQAGASVAAAAGFLVWFHRAYANLPALGMEPLPYAPGWAVGAWLVPLLNLVRPKQIMDTIWRGSDPDRPCYDGFWRRGPVPVLVHLWWAVFLLCWLVDRVVVVVLRHWSGTVEGLRTASIATLGSDAFGLLLGLLCLGLVWRATRRQRARAARLAVARPAETSGRSAPAGEQIPGRAVGVGRILIDGIRHGKHPTQHRPQHLARQPRDTVRLR